MTEEKHKKNIIVIQRWPILMDYETAAAYICVAKKTLQNEVSNGSFPVKHIKRGRKVLFHKKDLDKYADRLR